VNWLVQDIIVISLCVCVRACVCVCARACLPIFLSMSVCPSIWSFSHCLPIYAFGSLCSCCLSTRLVCLCFSASVWVCVSNSASVLFACLCSRTLSSETIDNVTKGDTAFLNVSVRNISNNSVEEIRSFDLQASLLWINTAPKNYESQWNLGKYATYLCVYFKLSSHIIFIAWILYLASNFVVVTDGMVWVRHVEYHVQVGYKCAYKLGTKCYF
jgi:hypothetical protein